MEIEEGYRFFGIGVVAVDKADNSRVVEAYPYEDIPFYEGDITDETVEQQIEGEDANGQAYVVKLKRGMTVPATWLGENNRWTAPNVKAGEKVELYTVGETDVFYWKAMGRNNKLRRTETVVYGWAASGEADDADVEQSQDNHYVVIVDTKNGHITLRTSKDRGEPVRYTIQVNTKDGLLIATDDKGNLIRVDSQATEIALINADGTTVRLSKKVIEALAEEKVYIESELLHVVADTYVDGRMHITGLVTSDEDFNAQNVSLVQHPHTGNLGYTTSTPLAITPYEPMAVGG